MRVHGIASIIAVFFELVPLGGAIAQEELSQRVAQLNSTAKFGDILQTINDWQKLDKSTRGALVLQLAKNLTSDNHLTLEESDLIIPSRIVSGKMKYPGHGIPVRQDLFLENGRCAYAIEQMLQIDLPTFSENMPLEVHRTAVHTSLLLIVKKLAS